MDDTKEHVSKPQYQNHTVGEHIDEDKLLARVGKEVKKIRRVKG